ncbi:histone [candidate division MSBL1 archaeon SCGC-AAA259M10]|uniref:Histone n=1 Tax=candidate division MSBL1 archaeon SCGC-AAA259M10 TaxID=1698270 RepID=A0A133UYP5_9EURY|nr:histone [candidate division MSBL1 archaeon SCGC-AAA259M10]
MVELPIASVDRIIRRVGGQRVSESAARELAEVLEEKGMEIANEATTLAEHAGRKTVRDEDIRLAMRKTK